MIRLITKVLFLIADGEMAELADEAHNSVDWHSSSEQVAGEYTLENTREYTQGYTWNHHSELGFAWSRVRVLIQGQMKTELRCVCL